MKWVWQMMGLSQFIFFIIALVAVGISDGRTIAALVLTIIFGLLAAYCEEKDEE